MLDYFRRDSRLIITPPKLGAKDDHFAPIPSNQFCNIEGCRTPAKFLIFNIENNQWLWVCGKHDSMVGKKNLVRCGLSYREAEFIDAAVKRQGRRNSGQKLYKKCIKS